MFTCLMHFIVTVKTINGALLTPIPASENFPPLSFFPLLSLSGYLVIFRKMSRCAGWRIHVFRFPLMLLYHESDRPLPRSIFNNFLDRGFPGRRAQHCVSIVSPACKQHPDFPDLQIDNQIPLSFSPLLSLSGYLVIFLNMSHAFISRVRPTASPFHTWPLFPSSVPGQACSTLCFHCSATYKQHPKFRDIQIDRRSPSSCLFRVTHFAVKSLETYNLTIGPSRLLSITCDPVLKPDRPLSILGHFLESLSRVGGFTKCPMLNRSSPSPPPSHFFLDMQLLSFNANSSSCRNR
jgi:hypothetical protein